MAKKLNKIMSIALTVALFAVVTASSAYADGMPTSGYSPYSPYSPYAPHVPVDTGLIGATDLMIAGGVLAYVVGLVLIANSQKLKAALNAK